MTAVSLLLTLFLASSTAILGLCLLNLRNKLSKQLQAHSEMKDLKQTQPIVSKSTRHSADRRKRESDSTSHGGCTRDEAPRGNGGVSKGFTTRQKTTKEICSDGSTNKSKAITSSLNNIDCRNNQAYGGVSSGYRVIRDVSHTLHVVSRSSDVSVSPNEAYKLCKTAKCKYPQ